MAHVPGNRREEWPSPRKISIVPKNNTEANLQAGAGTTSANREI
jgi:hypothetical protein